MVRDHRALGGETLGVLGLFLEIRQRDEQREIGVLVAGRLEHHVKLALDQLPDAVAPRLDHHAPAGLGVLREIGGLDDLLVPLGKILGTGRGDGGLFG